MAQKYKMVNYRILKTDEAEYLKIKDFIIKELGSDLCFIQWNLLRAFFNGLQNSPSPRDTIELKFLRQNIQLNIGCTINYNRTKARRIPREPPLELDKNHFFPLLLEEWATMSEKNKQFWRERLIEKGIIAPTPPFPLEKTGKLRRFFNFLWSRVNHLLNSHNKG